MRSIILAIKNATRRRLRTMVTMLGVAIAIAALYSLVSFQRGYRAGMDAELDRLGAHILVVPKGCPYDAASIALHGASWPCYLQESYVDQVRIASGVATAAPLLMNALYDSDSGVQTVYVGANTELLKLKRTWKIEGSFPASERECLVGTDIAKRLRLEQGSTFAFPGLAGEKGMVSGILAATHGADDGFIYVTLRRAQAMFHRPAQLTHILVRLTDPDMLDTVVADLHGCGAGMDMNVVPLTHLFSTIQGMVNSTRTLLGCVALVALLVAGGGVSNTVLMAVTERTREIGVMRAVGASRTDIFRLIWLETVEVCLAGGILGVLLAALGSHAIEAWLRGRLPFSPDGALVHPEPLVMALCLIWAVLLGSFAGLAPAWRASRLSPVEAIRAGAV